MSSEIAREILAVLKKHGFKSELDEDSIFLEHAKEDYEQSPSAIMYSAGTRHEIEGKKKPYISIRLVGAYKKKED